jgi:hypothetical protein
MAAGIALSISVFAAALFACWRRRRAAGLVPWLAVAASATSGGILLGIGSEKAFYESNGFAGSLIQGLLLAAAIVAPVMCSDALMAHPQPVFLESIGKRENRLPSAPALLLGMTFTLTTLVAAETALVLIFDPRSRDFPFASLTMAIVPIWTVTQLNPRKTDTRPFVQVRRPVRIRCSLCWHQRRDQQLVVPVDLGSVLLAKHCTLAVALRQFGVE